MAVTVLLKKESDKALFWCNFFNLFLMHKLLKGLKILHIDEYMYEGKKVTSHT